MSKVLGTFLAYLTRDGANGRFADAQIEAPNREQATVAAIKWAEGQLPPDGFSGSLFMKIGERTWLVKRWDAPDLH